MAFSITNPYLQAAAQAQQVAAQQSQYGPTTQGQAFTQNGNPTYGGAYNPMYHQANQQPITIKDLASLYYKSQGQGMIGDAPHPLAAAAKLSPFFGGEIKSPEDVKSLLQARVGLAGGDRQAVFDQLANQVNEAQTKQQTQKAGLSAAQAQALQGNTGKGKGGGAASDALTPDTMGTWFSSYVAPYMQQQQAMYDLQANMFDDAINQVLPTMQGPEAEIVKAYAPLISAAYHQKAADFSRNFLYGQDQQSLIGQLLKQGKRNSSILNFLKTQATEPTGLNGGSSDVFALLASGK